MHTIYGLQYLHVSLHRPRRHANEAPAHLHTIAFHQQVHRRQAAAVFHRGIRQQRSIAWLSIKQLLPTLIGKGDAGIKLVERNNPD